jgi:aspartate kinase
MKIFKFGGASVNSIERIQNLPSILNQFNNEKILMVISAMGKTTNALEKVAEAFFAGRKDNALQLFNEVKQQHNTTAKYLLVKNALACDEQLLNIYTEAEWLLHDNPVREFDYYYDQLVCVGELLSTVIVSFYLNEAGVMNQWIDVRDIMRTDDNYRDANINWAFTQQKTDEILKAGFINHDIIITQGFIGSTDENESTTLGREGSDYSAAIFANLLNAESLTIWKDVEGVMNADPKTYKEAQYIDELNYDEVIEMAYYGAQVIHPKTIKPLQNKSIPLYVKCFLDASLPGTVIHNSPVKSLPPIIVWKAKQVLMELRSKDFSFVGEKPVAELYELMADIKIKPNLTQNGAISFTAVFDERDRVEKLAHAAGNTFDVQVQRGLTLLTIRHYNREIYDKLTSEKDILLTQRTKNTVQVLMKD